MKSIIALIAFASFALVASASNIVFESSDGVWTDSIIDTKGRDFRQVLWTFEAYKLKEKKPDITLVRITAEPKEKEHDLAWKVPFHASSGHAKPYLPIYAKGDTEEVKRRTDAAYDYWNSK